MEYLFQHGQYNENTINNYYKIHSDTYTSMKAIQNGKYNPGGTEMVETKVCIRIVCRKSPKERWIDKITFMFSKGENMHRYFKTAEKVKNNSQTS